MEALPEGWREPFPLPGMLRDLAAIFRLEKLELGKNSNPSPTASPSQPPAAFQGIRGFPARQSPGGFRNSMISSENSTLGWVLGGGKILENSGNEEGWMGSAQGIIPVFLILCDRGWERDLVGGVGWNRPKFPDFLPLFPSQDSRREKFGSQSGQDIPKSSRIFHKSSHGIFPLLDPQTSPTRAAKFPGKGNSFSLGSPGRGKEQDLGNQRLERPGIFFPMWSHPGNAGRASPHPPPPPPSHSQPPAISMETADPNSMATPWQPHGNRRSHIPEEAGEAREC